MLFAALLLAGCSAIGLAYQQLPNLSYWWLDDYFDFNSAQSAQVRNGLDRVAQWHQQTQPELYAQLLDQASAMATTNFTAQQACQWLSDATQRANDIAAQVAPLAVPIMASLEPRQLAHYQAYIDQRNAQWRDEQLDGTPQDRLNFRLERSVKQLKRFYGSVTSEQEANVAQLLAASDYQPEQGFERRLANQARVYAWLQDVSGAQADSHAQHAQALQTLWATSMQWPAARQLRWCQQLVDIHNIMTPAQQQTARDTLAAYARDLRDLK
ncbi:DUF6279 family lipoprotein [Comamonadaceae bacterium M7527]|nr:DUF6279 family lipoprotein [Comamonadaceae bacterium M7527]